MPALLRSVYVSAFDIFPSSDLKLPLAVAVPAFSHCYGQRFITEQSNPTENRTRRSKPCIVSPKHFPALW